ncbi:oligosaccharide flippase family protein [Cupriavidus sp. WKF15]|uniref:oligosaccharide flippase family protein n=1 Tax=Cupriavidus sp. WKF15 TaxID=3032282 RepID=UPI0023E2862A|nr:oligosaccharide flippase family protein [Cupriavidus sp. WKF15]WER47329.1 oligosaccharide flippase family protein [Cupriavidus sp. WKF15]
MMRAQKNSEVHDVISKGLSALKWTYLGTLIKILSQLGVAIAFARLLGPESFGSGALLWMLVSVFAVLTDAGLSSAIVQCRRVCEGETTLILMTQLAIGMSLAATGAVFSGQIALFFAKENVAGPIALASFSALFQAFSHLPSALIRRRIDFRWIQLAQTISYLGGYALVGLSLAIVMRNEWSMAAAAVAQASLFAALLWWKAWREVKLASPSFNSELYFFGLKTVLSNMTNWLFSNMDAFYVGRRWGVRELGIYNRALNLAVTPTNALTSAAVGVVFSGASALAADTHKIKRLTILTVLAISALAFPGFAFLSAFSGKVISIVYGNSWSGAAELFAVFCLAMPFCIISGIAGPILAATGRPGMDTVAQLTAIAVLSAAILVFPNRAILVAYGVLAAHFCRFIFVAWHIDRQIINGKFMLRAIPSFLAIGLITTWLIEISQDIEILLGVPLLLQAVFLAVMVWLPMTIVALLFAVVAAGAVDYGIVLALRRKAPRSLYPCLRIIGVTVFNIRRVW